jgi:hypothetical protein
MDKPARPATEVPTAVESSEAKTERIAFMRHELAELQRQLSDAQQRIAGELQGRAEDADRLEELEARIEVQEQQAREEAVRAADLRDQNAALRARLDSAGKTAEELRKELAARDARLEESRRKDRELSEQLESNAAALRDIKALLATRDTELATGLGERDAEKAARAQVERELDVARGTQRELSELLETNASSLREVKGLLTEREAELAATTSELATLTSELASRTSERDVQEETRLRVEDDLAATRKTLDASRARMQELAEQIFKLGQTIVDVAATGEMRAIEAEPPAELPATAPAVAAAPVEIVSSPSRARGGLLLLAGFGFGLAAGFGVVALRGPKASPPREVAGGAPIDVKQLPAPGGEDRPTAPVAAAAQPAAAIDASAAAAVPPPSNPNAGVIVLPPSAEQHRVYLDGGQVLPKNGRLEVPCGPHKVQIGSRSPARMVDVACGAETALPDVGNPP